MSPNVEHFHHWMTFLCPLDRPHPARLLVVEGPAGSGKTTLLQAWLTILGLSGAHIPPLSLRPHLLSQTSEALPPAIHTTRALHRETPAQFARRLREELGKPPATARSAQQLWQQVRDDLSAIPVPLLVIDQAERLSLQLCQYLFEYLFEQHACSLLLMGTPVLSATLARDPSFSHHIFASHTIDQFDVPPDMGN